MKLTEFDKQSATWTKLKAHIESEIDILRQRNDADSDPIATAKLRGRIFELKRMLSLATSDERVVEQ